MPNGCQMGAKWVPKWPRVAGTGVRLSRKIIFDPPGEGGGLFIFCMGTCTPKGARNYPFTATFAQNGEQQGNVQERCILLLIRVQGCQMGAKMAKGW